MGKSTRMGRLEELYVVVKHDSFFVFFDTPPAIIDSTFFIRSVIRKQPDRMCGWVMVLFLICL